MNNDKEVKQKKIVFRAQGGGSYGWGHIYRCLNLAQWLKGKYKIFFVVNQNQHVSELLKRKGITFFEIGEKDVAEKGLNTVLSLQPDLVINDMLATPLEYMQMLKSKYIRTVNFDDASSHAKLASVLIDANRKERKAEKENKCFGIPYIVLNSLYSKTKKKGRFIRKKVKNIVVSFGGSDPNDLTTKVLEALQGRIPEQVQVDVIIGPSFSKSKKEFSEKWKHEKNIIFSDMKENLVNLFMNCDLALIGGGITMFEALSLGTPALVMAQNKPEAKNARRLDRRGLIFYLGEGVKVSKKKVIRKVNHFINSFDVRKQLSDKAKIEVDGRGIFRVLEKIEACIWIGGVK
jgi:spore coat polysaccharide biosynthesis predicted glycosyltransferase SpsG